LLHGIYYFVFGLRNLNGGDPSNLALWHVGLPRLYIDLGHGCPKVSTVWVDVVCGKVFDMLFSVRLAFVERGKGGMVSGHNDNHVEFGGDWVDGGVGHRRVSMHVILVLARIICDYF
jgi:hypothetical protein